MSRLYACAALLCAALGTASAAERATAPATQAELEAMAKKFAPVDLTVDLSALPPNEQKALAKLVAAAKLMDTLFLRQVWAGNEPLLYDLVQDPTPLGHARLRAFL